MRWCIALIACACSSKTDQPASATRDAPVTTREPEPAKPSDKPTPDANLPLTVHWANVERTPGCFFFSGPEGRDDQLVGEVVVEMLEREGTKVRIKIGTAEFSGTYDAGALVLGRKSQYDFNGPWSTTESVRGTMRDGKLEAKYKYEECELASKTCPGHCTVSGDVTFSREP